MKPKISYKIPLEMFEMNAHIKGPFRKLFYSYWSPEIPTGSQTNKQINQKKKRLHEICICVPHPELECDHTSEGRSKMMIWIFAKI